MTIYAPGGSCSSDSLCPKHGVPLVHTVCDKVLCAVCEHAARPRPLAPLSLPEPSGGPVVEIDAADVFPWLRGGSK
jgi:hypothetical protein